MARIYSVLVVFALVLLVSNIGLGWWVGDWNGLVQEQQAVRQRVVKLKKSVSIEKHQLRALEQSSLSPQKLAEARQTLQRLEKELQQQQRKQDEVLKRFLPMRGWQTVHFLLGVLAALVTVLVNSVSVTYFIGTTRWCREVVEEYGLDPVSFEQSRALKRSTYPWALGGVFVMLGIIVLGAAADPGASGTSATHWVTPHFMGALLGTAAIAWAFWVQIGTVGKNFEIIQEILSQVNTIRRQQNLDISEEVS